MPGWRVVERALRCASRLCVRRTRASTERDLAAAGTGARQSGLRSASRCRRGRCASTLSTRPAQRARRPVDRRCDPVARCSSARRRCARAAGGAQPHECSFGGDGCAAATALAIAAARLWPARLPARPSGTARRRGLRLLLQPAPLRRASSAPPSTCRNRIRWPAISCKRLAGRGRRQRVCAALSVSLVQRAGRGADHSPGAAAWLSSRSGAAGLRCCWPSAPTPSGTPRMRACTA